MIEAQDMHIDENLFISSFSIIFMIDFNKMIDDFLAREHKPKKLGNYYPSEIGSCLRKLWYSYKYPQEVKPDLIKVFELGNILHDFVVRVLKSEKVKDVSLLKTEFPIKFPVDDFVISGRVDDLILLKTDNRHVLVEVKSMKDVSFLDEPQNHHSTQLQFYMHATGVHDGLLLYIDKNTLNTKIFEMQHSEEMCRKIVERFRFLHKHLSEGRLPFPEAKAESVMRWMCRHCEYAQKCDLEEA